MAFSRLQKVTKHMMTSSRMKDRFKSKCGSDHESRDCV